MFFFSLSRLSKVTAIIEWPSIPAMCYHRRQRPSDRRRLDIDAMQKCWIGVYSMSIRGSSVFRAVLHYTFDTFERHVINIKWSAMQTKSPKIARGSIAPPLSKQNKTKKTQKKPQNKETKRNNDYVTGLSLIGISETVLALFCLP